MPEMLKEDKITSVITLLAAVIILGITIVINILYKPLIGFYLVSCFLLFLESDLIFPCKGKKIADDCYVMRYHKDHFIVTLNNHKIYITGERFSGDFDQIIYREVSPQWLPPYENEPVSDEDYEYVLNAVLKFLTKKKEKGVIR